MPIPARSNRDLLHSRNLLHLLNGSIAALDFDFPYFRFKLPRQQRGFLVPGINYKFLDPIPIEVVHELRFVPVHLGINQQTLFPQKP